MGIIIYYWPLAFAKKCIQLHYKMIAKLFKKLFRLIYHFKYFHIYMMMGLKYKFYVHWKSPKSDGWTHERVQCIVGVYTQSSVWFRLWRSVHRTIYAPESLETWYTIVLLLKYHIFYRFVQSIVSVHQRRKQDFSRGFRAKTFGHSSCQSYFRIIHF